MKTTRFKIAVACTVCSLLAASAWAQSESQSGNSSQNSNERSWSTKHLSATGRMNAPAVRASKLMGAQVKDSSGQNVGQIQDTIIDPASGRIDFALLMLEGTGASPSSTPPESSAVGETASQKLVPVPWSLLRTSASSQYAGSSERPTFTLNADINKLKNAPTVNWSDLSQSEWQQRIYSYYGVTPRSSSSSMGGAESPQGEIKGEGARSLTQPNPQQQQQNPSPNQ